MKLPITDQFLWELYRTLEPAGDVVNFMLSSKRRQLSILAGGENPIFKKYRHDMGKRHFSKLIYYLKRNNYIKVKSLEGNKAIIITKEGLSKVLKASFVAEGGKKRKDGKWIMLIFDIPEKRPKARSLLKSILQNLGYKLFQQSVWVTPYDVSKKTENLLQLHSLDRYVKIFLIEQL